MVGDRARRVEVRTGRSSPVGGVGDGGSVGVKKVGGDVGTLSVGEGSEDSDGHSRA